MDLLYDIESFEYVNGLFQYLYGVTVRADSPYKTFEDLVEEAKKRPVFYSVGSFANTVPMVQINENMGHNSRRSCMKAVGGTLSSGY